MHVVYRHTSTITGKSYIGVTSKSWEVRWAGHCRSARDGSQFHFHRAIAAYGVDAWTHDVLVSGLLTADDASVCERAMILEHRTFEPEVGYNSTFGGEGCSCTEETRAKLSASLLGNEKLKNLLRGRKFSAEHCKKIGDAKRGTKHTDETRKKLSDSHRAPRAPLTEVTKQKIRDAQLRRWARSRDTAETFTEALKDPCQ